MKNSKRILKAIIAIFFLFIPIEFWGQSQPPQKSPVEIASETADRLQRDLELNHYQHFKIDSILQTNLVGVSNQFEEMRKAGMQNPESFREVQELWKKRTDDALIDLLTLEQYEEYLKISRVPKRERKEILENIKKSRGEPL